MKKYLIFIFTPFFLTSCATISIPASKPGDASLTCSQIALEINEMNDVIGDQNKSRIAANLANVGTGAAYTAASLGKAIPFLGSAVGAVNGVSGMTKSQADKVAQQAEMRRSTLTGLYVGKNCDAMLAAQNEQIVQQRAAETSAKIQAGQEERV